MSADTLIHSLYILSSATQIANYRNKIVTEIYGNQQIKSADQNIIKNSMYRDLLQELSIFLLEMKAEILFKKYEGGYLTFTCIRWLRNNVYDNTSKFNSRNRFVINNKHEVSYDNALNFLTYYKEPDPEEEKTIKEKLLVLIPEIKQCISTCHWYDQLLFLEYVNSDYSLREMEKHFHIPGLPDALQIKFQEINKGIKKVVLIVKQHLEDKKLLDN